METDLLSVVAENIIDRIKLAQRCNIKLTENNASSQIRNSSRSILSHTSGSFYIFVTGPTASGKSQFAVHLADALSNFIHSCSDEYSEIRYKKCIILNADSMQIYSNFPLLTALPSESEFDMCHHELFAYLDIHELLAQSKRRAVGDWLSDVKMQMDIHSPAIYIFVGGTGMYISRLLHGLDDSYVSQRILQQYSAQIAANTISIQEMHDKLNQIAPEYMKKISRNDKYRILRSYAFYMENGRILQNTHLKNVNDREFDANSFDEGENILKLHSASIYMAIDRQLLHSRIEDRLHKIVDCGVVEEVRKFIRDKRHLGITPDCCADSSVMPNIIGFREIASHIEGCASLNDTVLSILYRTRQYAKRQETWFRNQMKHDIIFTYSKP